MAIKTYINRKWIGEMNVSADWGEDMKFRVSPGEYVEVFGELIFSSMDEVEDFVKLMTELMEGVKNG